MITILIALLCLALLVYLPKLRRVVFWILCPMIMVMVAFPRTRGPLLILYSMLAIAIGIGAAAEHQQAKRENSRLAAPAPVAQEPPTPQGVWQVIPDPGSVVLPSTIKHRSRRWRAVKDPDLAQASPQTDHEIVEDALTQ